MKAICGVAVVCALLVPVAAQAAEANRSEFGKLPDGLAVEAITLSNARGMSVRVISYGAILQSVSVPDREGHSAEVALGYDSMEGYLVAPNYFGATVGRYANRIRAGKFSIDGKSYQLAKNNNGNALHGGPAGFDKRLWTATAVCERGRRGRLSGPAHSDRDLFAR